MRSARRITSRRGFILPAVLLFLAIAFGMWAVLFRSAGSALRIDEARSHRAARAEWTASAVANGLRLLETGSPPSDPYVCKLSITQDAQTRWFRLTYEQIS